jgi:hypothetical protein
MRDLRDCAVTEWLLLAGGRRRDVVPVVISGLESPDFLTQDKAERPLRVLDVHESERIP